MAKLLIQKGKRINKMKNKDNYRGFLIMVSSFKKQWLSSKVILREEGNKNV
jgi:hypothetical protein